MCDKCNEYNGESEEWESVPCDCACAEESIGPNELLEDGTYGDHCSECGHRTD